MRNDAPTRQAIALISDDADPAIDTNRQEAGERNIYVRRVGEALAKVGWRVDMFTRRTDPDAPAVVQHSPYCRTIRLDAGPAALVPRDQRFDVLPEFLEEFLKYQSKEHYPLVHTSYWTAGWVGLQLKQQHNLQLVHTYHSLGVLKYQPGVARSAIADRRIAIEQQVLELADCIIATSPQEKDTLHQLMSAQGTVEIVPAGTDLDTFRTMPQTEARQRLGIASQEPMVLYVGRFDARKGIETLVRAFAQLPDSLHKARLVIVGGDDPAQDNRQERQRIEHIVHELQLGDRIDFVGQVGHERLPTYYTAADVCVIPSQYEPFGLVALESMACGTPVVASNTGGLRFTVVPEETGLLVPPEDVAGFAKAIERVLTDQIWAQKLKSQAPARVQQNFSWTGVAVRLSDVYRRIMAQSISHEQLWCRINPAESAAASAPASALAPEQPESSTIQTVS